MAEKGPAFLFANRGLHNSSQCNALHLMQLLLCDICESVLSAIFHFSLHNPSVFLVNLKRSENRFNAGEEAYCILFSLYPQRCSLIRLGLLKNIAQILHNPF